MKTLVSSGREFAIKRANKMSIAKKKSGQSIRWCEVVSMMEGPW